VRDAEGQDILTEKPLISETDDSKPISAKDIPINIAPGILKRTE
jgi:hypothetical protein